ncbi:hypothetical protein EWM64_g1258 [Hericium alpestre]|uniref:Uncharacterized protein n=1 Tax=Hericium alpestre TaxID=135208 RepID=A0A4Z0A7N9_9AGAM|nr:hypothetical protein EWM64_g1258 [Hericium alpestre]
MEDYFDCICFGLTCCFLWEVARRHVHKRYEEDAPSSWIGDRVVCAGSFSSADDEFTQFLMGKKGPEWTADGSQNLFSFARQHYTEVLPRLQAIDTLNIRALRYAECRGFGFQDRKNLYAVLCPFNNCQPVVAEAESSGTGVIRNLSKKVYIREDAISWLIFGREWHSAGSIGLAAVVWLRTAWSTDDRMGLRHNPISAHQGPWAGDRLDFVANLEFVKTEVGEDGFPVAWKDESCDIVRDLIKVWERVRKEAEEDEANWAGHAGDAFNTPVNVIVEFMMPGW